MVLRDKRRNRGEKSVDDSTPKIEFKPLVIEEGEFIMPIFDTNTSSETL
jgi:hypothetical protein